MENSGTDKEIAEQLSRVRKKNWKDRCLEAQSLEKSAGLVDGVVLLHLLDDSSSEVRRQALDALWTAGVASSQLMPAARVAARAGLTDTDWCVRSTAAETLGELGTQGDIPRLCAALQDREWVVRASAAGSLGALGADAVRATKRALGVRAARRALEQALSDRNAHVRRYVAVALSRLGDPEVAPLLEERLGRERQNRARVGLLSGLYSLGQRERLDEVLALLNDPDMFVRASTADGLSEDTRPEDRPRVLSALRSYSENEENPGLRTNAVRVISKLERAQDD